MNFDFHTSTIIIDRDAIKFLHTFSLLNFKLSFFLFFFFVHPTKNFSSFNKNTKPDVTILLSTTSFVSVSGTEDKNSDYVRFLISKFLLPVSTSRDFQYPFKPWNPRALFEFLNRKIRERK